MTPPSLSAPAQAEWRALSRERDPLLRAEGLLSLAGRLEARTEDAAAASIYDQLSQAGGNELASVRRRAADRLAGLRGGGSFGARAENFFRHFVSQSTDPASLFAMGAAGATFRLVRLGSLARLFAAPNASVGGVWGARALASLIALGAESLVFPVAGRLGHAVLGREQEWSFAALSREWGAGLLTLGALRGSGAAMGLAARRWAAQGSVSTWLLSQSSMLGGIWFAQHLEGRMGLRPEQGPSASFADAFATLLHFNVAGRLSRAAFGRNFGNWERSLDLRSETLIQRLPPLWRTPPSLLPEPALAVAMHGGPNLTAENKGPRVLLSEALPPQQIEATFPPTIYRDYHYHRAKDGPPPRIRYSQEGLQWWRQWGARLRSVDPKLPPEQILADRLPLREASRIWRMQIEDFAGLLGGQLEVHPPTRLLEAMGPGYLRRNPTLLKSSAELAGEGAEVYELHLPYSSIRFGEANVKGEYANLFHIMGEMERAFGNHVFLAHVKEGKTVIRFPSFDLWDAMNVVHFGGSAHRMVPVSGVIGRDRVMGLRENMLAPLGLTRQAAQVQDIQGLAHAFFVALHDAFHSTISSTLPPETPAVAGRLYWLAKAGLPRSVLKEDLLDRLSDLDPGSNYSRRPEVGEFWYFTLANFWRRFYSESAEENFIGVRLPQYPEFLRRYQVLIQRTAPRTEAEAKAFKYISGLLDLDSQRLNEFLLEVLRHSNLRK